MLFSDFRRPDDFRADDVVPDPEPFARNLRSILVLGRSRGQRVVPPTKELSIDEIHVFPQGARLEAELATKFLLENGFVR